MGEKEPSLSKPKKKIRVNGFTRPWSRLQIAAWAYHIIQCSVYFIVFGIAAFPEFEESTNVSKSITFPVRIITVMCCNLARCIVCSLYGFIYPADFWLHLHTSC